MQLIVIFVNSNNSTHSGYKLGRRSNKFSLVCQKILLDYTDTPVTHLFQAIVTGGVVIWGVPKIRGSPKWMVCNGKPYENG